MLKGNRGHIVAVSSVAGLRGVAEAAEYSATKHGIMGEEASAPISSYNLLEKLLQQLTRLNNSRTPII